MLNNNIVTSHEKYAIESYDDRAEWAEIFAAGDLPVIDHPAFRRYCRLFYDFFRKAPCHIKRSYETGFIAQKKAYKHRDGFYYTRCLEQQVARHLEPFDRKPYWIALRFGDKSSVKCIDSDNKPNVIGHYKENGYWRPVVHLPLEHFRRLKRLYDAFPNHVWCVSSATLGLHVWEKLRYPQTAEEVERRNRSRLVSLGLGNIELYPSPQLRDQVLRRPFGLDYYTITDGGLLTDWVDQLDHFESANPTPAFPSIVRSLLELAGAGWSAVERGAKFRRCRETPFAFKRSLNLRLLVQEAEQVEAWVRAGCPDDVPDATGGISSTEALSPPVAVSTSQSPRRPRRTSADGSGGWSWRMVVDLARHGVPEEHKLYQFLLWLARPLVWRDYFHLPESERVRRAEEDLLHWVLNKHNGLVTRVHEGRIADIRHEVRRQVRVAMTETDQSLQDFYANVREQDRRHPERVERLPDLIRSKPALPCPGIAERPSTTPPSESDSDPQQPPGDDLPSPPPVCCRRYIKEPDDSPLPAAVRQVLEQAVKMKRMRKKDGECPFVRFARRLLNALWEGDGAAEIHGDILRAWCGTKNRAQVVGYKMCMAEVGLISDQWEGHAERGRSSAVYQMIPETFDHFQQHYGTAKTMRRVESQFTITALTLARLEELELGWGE